MSRLEKDSVELFTKKWDIKTKFPLLFAVKCNGCGDEVVRETVWKFENIASCSNYLSPQYLCLNCCHTLEEVVVWIKVEEDRKANRKPPAPPAAPPPIPAKRIEVVIKKPAERIIALPKPPQE